jgi:hypothetical protein
MAGEHPICTWTGASGKQYQFYVWPRHPDVNADQMGNYIYTKINDKNEYVPIYIGEGDLSVRCTKNHHQIKCIDSKGATSVHLVLCAKEADRLAMERDLLAGYPQAYAPTGCNVKEGG